VLPEMAFTGYMFESMEEIRPFAEDENGETFRFCKEWSLRLDACVAAGYALKDGTTSSGEARLFNAMCVVDKNGELRCTYKKTFLYTTDKSWATKGDGFVAFDLDGTKVSNDIREVIFPFANI